MPINFKKKKKSYFTLKFFKSFQDPKFQKTTSKNFITKKKKIQTNPQLFFLGVFLTVLNFIALMILSMI